MQHKLRSRGKKELKKSATEQDGGEEEEKDEPPVAEDGDDEDADEPDVIRVPGEIGSIIERLSKEYTKALQQTDPRTYAYIARLEDRGLIVSLAEKGVQQYYTRKEEKSAAARAALLRIEFMYFPPSMTRLRTHCANPRC